MKVSLGQYKSADEAEIVSVAASEMSENPNSQTQSPVIPNNHINRFKLRLKQFSTLSISTNSSIDEEDIYTNGNCKPKITLKTPTKLLNNIASNWRLKSLQAKNERRERRATKTLAVVLGNF